MKAAAFRQPAAQRQAKALIADAKCEAAKLIAIRNFVAKNIRFAGPGLDELPLSAITPADRTLDEGYGNSADRAVLLCAMLRAAGFRPAFILASGVPVVAGMEPPLLSAPAASDFNAVLVRVRLDGKDVYLNDTNEYAALGDTAHDGCYGLGLDAGKTFTLRAWPEMEYRTDVDYDVQVQATGDAVIRKRTIFYGAGYADAHKKFAEMVPEERRRYFQEAVAQIAQAAVAQGELQTDFDSYPGTEQFTVRVPRYAVRADGYLYFTLPASLQDLFGFRSETRENPIYWSGPRRIAIRTALTLPPEFPTPALQPPDFEWQAPQSAGVVRVLSCGKPPQAPLVIEQTVNLLPALIPAMDYDDLLHIQTVLNHPSARTILATGK